METMQNITYHAEGQLGVITLNRPETLNAVSPIMYQEIKIIMDSIKNDQQIRVVIITGAGERIFCAGADIEVMKSMTPYEIRAFASYGLEAFKAITGSAKPVIAGVNGLALGAGCELTLACDIVIASSRARFGLPELSIGVIPGGGGTQRLIRLVGNVRAKELILTGRNQSREEALQMGMINQVVAPEELMETVKKTAFSICQKGPIAVHLAKAAMNQSFEVPLAAGLDYELECFSSLYATHDQKEGMQAFLEKRPPQFKGF